MRLSLRHRELARSVLRRLDRTAGAINPFLLVIAVGLAIIDVVYSAQTMLEALPVAVQAGVRAP